MSMAPPGFVKASDLVAFSGSDRIVFRGNTLVSGFISNDGSASFKVAFVRWDKSASEFKTLPAGTLYQFSNLPLFMIVVQAASGTYSGLFSGWVPPGEKELAEAMSFSYIQTITVQVPLQVSLITSSVTLNVQFVAQNVAIFTAGDYFAKVGNGWSLSGTRNSTTGGGAWDTIASRAIPAGKTGYIKGLDFSASFPASTGAVFFRLQDTTSGTTLWQWVAPTFYAGGGSTNTPSISFHVPRTSVATDTIALQVSTGSVFNPGGGANIDANAEGWDV